MGMAHRGRLNVLANVVGKSYEQIFREFEGELDPSVPQGSGDVKYHVGATGKFTAASGATIGITLAANPSHLEAVDPVVEGMARAKQDRLGDTDHDRVLSVLIHGDAAFAGQGVVAETLNLSRAPGLRRRRHGAHRRQQPGRLHDHARLRPLDRVRHRHRQGGAGADLPRERRRPRSVRCARSGSRSSSATSSRRTSSSTWSATGATGTTRATSPRSRSRGCTR